jgi:hypothetical protein
MVDMMRRQGISQDYVAKIITDKVTAGRQTIAAARATTPKKIVPPVTAKPIDPVVAQAAAAWTEFFEDDFARNYPAVAVTDRKFFAVIAAGAPVGARAKEPYRRFTKGNPTGPVHELRKIMRMDPTAARVNYDLWRAGKLELPVNPPKHGPKMGD